MKKPLVFILIALLLTLLSCPNAMPSQSSAQSASPSPNVQGEQVILQIIDDRALLDPKKQTVMIDASGKYIDLPKYANILLYVKKQQLKGF